MPRSVDSRRLRSRAAVVFVLLVGAFTPRDAHAYIDPASGSMILQVVAAGLLAASFTMKRFWGNVGASVRRFWGRLSGR